MKQNQMHIKVYYKCKRQKTKAAIFAMKSVLSMAIIAVLMVAGYLFPTSTIGVLAGNIEEVMQKDNLGKSSIVTREESEENLLTENFAILTYNETTMRNESFNNADSMPSVGAEEVISNDLEPVVINTVKIEPKQESGTEIQSKVGDSNEQGTDDVIDKITNRRTNAEESISRYAFQNNEEYENFCRVVEAEVTGDFKSNPNVTYEEGLASKIRVAQVILQRVESEQFPNTVNEVIFQKNQFTPVLDGRFYKVTVTDTTREAIRLALDSSYPSLITKNGKTAEYFSSGTTHCDYGVHMFTDDVNQSFFSPKKGKETIQLQ